MVLADHAIINFDLTTFVLFHSKTVCRDFAKLRSGFRARSFILDCFYSQASDMIPLNNGVNGSLCGRPEHCTRKSSREWRTWVYNEQASDLSPGLPINKDCDSKEFGMDGHGKTDRQRYATGRGILPFITFFLILITLPQTTFAMLTSPQPRSLALEPALVSRALNDTSSLLDCFQVAAPVDSPTKPNCQQTLMVHTFGWSYGIPYVGQYTPPNCDFDRVSFNFTVTSAGRQFDRLGLMFFNDTEIWRTSTAEPTANGIIWSYEKDMTNFLSLFKEPQKIIFDLGNIVDDTYTGSWYTTLTATFFTEGTSFEPADIIIPVSARKSSSDLSSAFVVPDSPAFNIITIPQNVKKAVFSISACGQAAEEFWWSNVLSSDTNIFDGTTLYGYSPFRELQLLIDGKLAGVAWPFPVIFTGGIVPGFWRPVVGIDAFDLREDEIDITAFLPLLCDGKEHSFEIRVAGISDDGQGNGVLVDTVGSNWVVTGKLFIWLDSVGHITTGTLPTISSAAPVLRVVSSTTKTGNGTVSALDYSVKAARSFSVSSIIRSSAGKRTASWKQDLTYANAGTFSNSGNNQINKQTTSGNDASSGLISYSKSFQYPLNVISTYTVLAGGNYTITGDMSRGKNVQKFGALAFPNEAQTYNYGKDYIGTISSDSQNGTAAYLAVPAIKKSFGSGTTEEKYSLAAIAGSDLYKRHVLAINDTLVLDEESFVGQSGSMKKNFATKGAAKSEFAEKGVKAMLGRGPN